MLTYYLLSVLPDQDLLTADTGLAAGFGRARFLVLDEADRLLEKSFEGELAVIAGALPERRQTLLLSATLTRSMGLLQASALRGAYLFRVGVARSGSPLQLMLCRYILLPLSSAGLARP